MKPGPGWIDMRPIKARARQILPVGDPGLDGLELEPEWLPPEHGKIVLTYWVRYFASRRAEQEVKHGR